MHIVNVCTIKQKVLILKESGNLLVQGSVMTSPTFHANFLDLSFIPNVKSPIALFFPELSSSKQELSCNGECLLLALATYCF